MPLLKCKESKSTPHKAIAYITREDKAAYVSTRNLFEDEDYAEQFEQTARFYGKGKKYEERKFYHFKLSCDRKDNVSPQEAQIFAEELTARLFPDCECVIATHTDTKTVHSHIIVNAVHPLTGKKLRISRSDYTAMKDEANRLGKEMGFSELDFRKKSKNKRTAEERHIILKGGTSWKEDLREVIEEAKQTATSQEEFIQHLKLYGVEVTRSKTEYSFLHPERKKAIRGHKLGANYTKKEIDFVIEKNRHGRGGNTALSITGDERGKESEPRKQPFERGVGDIQREMQQLDRQAEYARRGLDYASERVEEEQRKSAAQPALHSNGNDKPNGKDVGERKDVQGAGRQGNKRGGAGSSK